MIQRRHLFEQYRRPAQPLNMRAEDGLGAFTNEISLLQALFGAFTTVTPPYPWPNIPTDSALLTLDLSKWNGAVDFETLKSRGVRAVWIKAIQGEWVDARFDEHVRGATDAGIDFGVYTFIDVTQPISAIRAAIRAASVTRGVGNLSLWLDAERSGTLSPTQMANYLLDFSGEYGVHDPRIQEIYTRLSFWNPSVARRSQWEKYRLNAARYNLALTSPWSDGSYPPYDWPRKWESGWQYSADGNGMGAYFGCQSNSVDMNAWHGSEQDFVTFYGLSQPNPEPEPTPEPEPVTMEDNFNTLFDGQNFRTEPSTARGSASVIMKLAAGSTLRACPCPSIGLPYSGMRVYIPGASSPREVWLHGQVNGIAGWLAAQHPTRDGGFVKSMPPG